LSKFEEVEKFLKGKFHLMPKICCMISVNFSAYYMQLCWIPDVHKCMMYVARFLSHWELVGMIGKILAREK
jgi:hypothetical protein